MTDTSNRRGLPLGPPLSRVERRQLRRYLDAGGPGSSAEHTSRLLETVEELLNQGTILKAHIQLLVDAHECPLGAALGAACECAYIDEARDVLKHIRTKL